MIRWTIGSGGFIGEISLVPAEPFYLHMARDGTPLMEVNDLFVHPLRRGQGWAHELMTQLTRECDRKGYDCALVISPHGIKRTKDGRKIPVPGTEKLRLFYREYGFTSVPQFKLWPLMMRRV